MKKVIFTLLLPVLFLARVNAQNLIITPSDSVSEVDTATTLLSSFPQYISIKNNGPDTIQLFWHNITDTSVFNAIGWSAQFCDNENCYSLPTTETSGVVPPGDSISMHSLIGPNCNTGTATVQISARVSHYDTTLILSYTLKVLALCAQGINDVTDGLNINLYPNPTSNVVYINGLVPGHEINVQLMDVAGQVLSNTNTISSETYSCDVNKLPAGIYFVTVRDSETHLTGAAKFTKF
jgi:hypothetical protein